MQNSSLFQHLTVAFKPLTLALLSALLVACGGGAADEADKAPADPTVANAEAARIAAIYRYMQGLASIALSNLSEPHVGGTRNGTVSCSGGGSATYADTTPSPGADPRSSVSFDACVEPVGLVDGTLTLRSFLNGLNAQGVGTFNVEWQADVTVDGYGMRFESNTGLTTVSADGSVRIETFGGADPAMTLTAPNGSSVQFLNVRLDVQYDPATGIANFGGSDVHMRSLSDADRNARLMPSDLRAPATPGAAVISVGVPSTGSFVYRRSFDQTATDLAATGTTSSSVLNLTVDALPASYSFSGSAGQYAWTTIVESPDLSLPATAP